MEHVLMIFCQNTVKNDKNILVHFLQVFFYRCVFYVETQLSAVQNFKYYIYFFIFYALYMFILECINNLTNNSANVKTQLLRKKPQKNFKYRLNGCTDNFFGIIQYIGPTFTDIYV